MASETLSPNSLDVQSNLSGGLAVVQQDPDTSGTFLAAAGDTLDTLCRVSFPTPSGDLNSGAGLQTFRIRWRTSSAGDTPDSVAVDLLENGSVVTANIYTLANPGGEYIIVATWDAGDLSDISGVDVQVQIYTQADIAPPPQTATGEIGGIEWIVDYTEPGGTIYERTLSDEMNVADQADRYADALRHALSNFGLSDSVLSSAISQALLSDSMSVIDGEALRLQWFNYNKQDSFSINDSIIQTLQSVGYARILADNFEINDTVMSSANLERLISSAFDLNDNVIRSIIALEVITRTLSDNFTLNDGDLELRKWLTVTATDSFDINDSAIQELILRISRSLSDKIDLQDFVISTVISAANVIARTLIDAIEMEDGGIERLQWFNYTKEDSLELNDSVNIVAGAISEIFRRLEQYLPFFEIDFHKYVSYNYTAIQQIDFTDSVTREIIQAALISILLNDEFDFTDGVSQELILRINRVLTEVIEFQDVVSAIIEATNVILITIEDYMEVIDSGVEKTHELNYLVKQPVDFQDQLKAFAYYMRTINQTVNFQDGAIKRSDRYRLAADSIQFNDDVSRYADYLRNPDDSMGVEDSIHRMSSYLRTTSEYIDFNDVVDVDITGAIVVVERLLSDNFALFSVLSRDVDVHRLLTDVILMTDSVMKAAAFKRLLSDKYDIQDALVQATVLRITRILMEQLDIDDRVISQFIQYLRAFGFAKMLLLRAMIQMKLKLAPIVMGVHAMDDIEMTLEDR